jgi:hypothetical protein
LGAWRFRVGRKGVSRVTVFERHDATSIFVEWWDDEGRHRAALSTVVGHPVTSREMAEEVARRMSAAQERRRNQQAADMLGIPTVRTLTELLDRRHADLEPTWSTKYAKSRKLRKAFWLDKLGDARLTHVRAAVVERVTREAQDAGSHSDRWRQDVLRYLVDSYIYAEKKLKWIEPRHNLSAVTIPRASGRGAAYSLLEVRKLIPELWKVEPRAGWMGSVAFQTGRRIGAIRRLEPIHVIHAETWTAIRFPRETDKPGKGGEAWVYELPERTDWRVPSHDEVDAWMEAAEEAAEVKHVDGRLWHGVKRLYATLVSGQPGADLQAGTLRSTLDGRYRQDVAEPKMAVAKDLAGRLAGR